MSFYKPCPNCGGEFGGHRLSCPAYVSPPAPPQKRERPYEWHSIAGARKEGDVTEGMRIAEGLIVCRVIRSDDGSGAVMSMCFVPEAK